MPRWILIVVALAACGHGGDDAAAPRADALRAHDVDAGSGQPPEEPLCRKAVENYARLRGLALDAAQLRSLTQWCMDGSAAVTTCMAAAQNLRDADRCDSLGAEDTSFGNGAESLASRPSPAECDEAIGNLLRLVPEARRDAVDFRRACLGGTRAQMSCVTRAIRPEDLTRCP